MVKVFNPMYAETKALSPFKTGVVKAEWLKPTSKQKALLETRKKSRKLGIAHKGNNGAHVMQNHYISDMVCICDNNSANNQKVSACGTARMCSNLLEHQGQISTKQTLPNAFNQ